MEMEISEAAAYVAVSALIADMDVQNKDREARNTRRNGQTALNKGSLTSRIQNIAATGAAA